MEISAVLWALRLAEGIYVFSLCFG